MHGSKEILCVLSGQGGVAVGISGVQLYIALISVWSEHGRRVREDGTAQGREGEVETIATNDQLRSGLGLWAVSIVPIGLCILVAKRLLTLDDRKSVSVRDEGRKQRRYRLISSSADDEVEQEEHGEGEYRDDIGINSDNDEGLDYYPDRSQTRQPKEYQSSSNPSSFFSPTRLAQRILGEKTAELLIKNRVVYFSIAWVFVVTLVSSRYSLGYVAALLLILIVTVRLDWNRSDSLSFLRSRLLSSPSILSKHTGSWVTLRYSWPSISFYSTVNLGDALQFWDRLERFTGTNSCILPFVRSLQFQTISVEATSQPVHDS
jgi:hypothetical protein